MDAWYYTPPGAKKRVPLNWPSRGAPWDGQWRLTASAGQPRGWRAASMPSPLEADADGLEQFIREVEVKTGDDSTPAQVQ